MPPSPQESQSLVTPDTPDVAGMLTTLENDKMSTIKKENGSQDSIGKLRRLEDSEWSRGCLLAACEEGPGICSLLLTIGSLVLVLVSLPLSLFVVIKVVQVNDNIEMCQNRYESFVFLLENRRKQITNMKLLSNLFSFKFPTLISQKQSS